MRYEILVKLKPEVLDPEARAIQETLAQKYNHQIRNIHVAKRFELNLEVSDQQVGLNLASQIAQEYLANPVSESFEVKYIP